MGKDLTGMFERAFAKHSAMTGNTPAQQPFQNSPYNNPGPQGYRKITLDPYAVQKARQDFYGNNPPPASPPPPVANPNEAIDNLLFPEKTAARTYQNKQGHIDNFLRFVTTLNDYELKWLTKLEASNIIMETKEIKKMVENGQNLYLDRISPQSGPTLVKREYIQDTSPEIEFSLTSLGRAVLSYIRSRGQDRTLVNKLMTIF